MKDVHKTKDRLIPISDVLRILKHRGVKSYPVVRDLVNFMKYGTFRPY